MSATAALEALRAAPARVQSLARDRRGYPVPWFVAWQHGEPVFPAIDADKFRRAVQLGRCWICGDHLGRYRASVIGPMCAINRTVSEPQSHLECARFAARHCPFLARPGMKRAARKTLPDEIVEPGGNHLEHNPGACAVWIERRASRLFQSGTGPLFQLGEPEAVEWFCEGREATRDEIEQAIARGIPLLREACFSEPPGALRDAAFGELERRRSALEQWLPAA